MLDGTTIFMAVAKQKLAMAQNIHLCADLNEKCCESILRYVTPDVIARILFITWAQPPYTSLREKAMYEMSTSRADAQ